MGILESDARWLFQQLLIAVDYCHRLGIANRDIKVRGDASTGAAAGSPISNLLAQLPFRDSCSSFPDFWPY